MQLEFVKDFSCTVTDMGGCELYISLGAVLFSERSLVFIPKRLLVLERQDEVPLCIGTLLQWFCRGCFPFERYEI